MTTPPTAGLLAWGQAGHYNAIDDRAVITALAGGRTGLMSRPHITAGTGLQVLIAGGWFAVVDAGDGTAAVVGTRNQSGVMESAGPSSGAARVRHIWCDVDPAAATWTLNLRAASELTGRPGISLGTVTAPVGAATASAMTFTAAHAMLPLAKGVLAAVQQVDTNTARSVSTFANAADLNTTAAITLDPGRWYRARWRTPDAALVQGSFGAAYWALYAQIAQRVGAGAVNPLGPVHTSRMTPGTHGLRQTIFVEESFTGMTAGDYHFSVRMWRAPEATSSPQFAPDIDQRGMLLTVEDLGPGPGYTNPTV